MLESIYESDKLDFIDMKIKETKIKIPSYEITSESAYLNRESLSNRLDYYHWELESVNEALVKINQSKHCNQ